MNSKKALKKSKATWLAIDILLLLGALVLGACCVRKINQIRLVSNTGYEEAMARLDAQEAEILRQIELAKPEMDAMIPEKETIRDTAQVTRDTALADLKAAIDSRNEIQAEIDRLKVSMSGLDGMDQRVADLRAEYGAVVRQFEEMIQAGESDYRICYLTFDDGPSYNTEKFLDELDRLDVKATFFTIGIGVQESSFGYRDACLRREAASGHTIANHTYTHAFNGALYKSAENFLAAVQQQDAVVYNAAGVHTDIVRFPAGSYYCYYRTSSIELLEQNGYTWIDWLGNSFDSGSNKHSSAYIASNVISQARTVKIYVVLMHDFNTRTLGALSTIVNTLRDDNYVFLPLFKESVTMADNTYPRWDN